MTKRFVVLKFGGSSQGTADRLERVTTIIRESAAQRPTAVVVSALGGSTDRLIRAAECAARGDVDGAKHLIDDVFDLASNHAQLVDDGPARDAMRRAVDELASPLRNLIYGVSLLREYTKQSLDLILSFGERLSATLMRELLAYQGLNARYVDARDWCVTGPEFGEAVVDWTETARRVNEHRSHWQQRVSVHTGFLGRTPSGQTTTLGRNGSDYTATLLARALEAEQVTIWTDVSGVMTADPVLVPYAYPIERLSYMEALELSNFGARMFHPRTMVPLIAAEIPLQIRNTLDGSRPGTRVCATGSDDPRQPTSVTNLENLALLDIQAQYLSYRPRIGERVQRALDREDTTVWLATHSAHGQALSVVVPVAQAETAKRAVELEFAGEIERGELQRVGIEAPVTLLTLVAEKMGKSVNVAGRQFAALGNVGVNVMAIGQSASSRSISCVVPAEETTTAVRAVHDAFNFAHQTVSLLVLGKGVVGSQLLAQIDEAAEALRDRNDIDVRLAGLADQHRVVFDEKGIDPGEWRGAIARAPSVKGGPHGPVTEEILERLRRLPVPILVDVTAADGMNDLYQAAFRRGIHVVAANKKPLTVPTHDYRELLNEARQSYRAYRYETTVGASLPVIDTLKNLVRTGDRVTLIEGSFSGTLGYLTQELMAGTPLAQAVRTAKDLGYTEPHPRDDLSGLDAARKALILARELGLTVSLEDIALEPLVPQHLLEEADLDAFFAKLVAFEPTLAKTLDGYRRENKNLRYLARIDPLAKQGEVMKVGPIPVGLDHPATHLRSAESFVAFTTQRYAEYPLIVQGAGAGGAVTAAGVLADVLAIAQTLRGR
ncbi:MAG: bifunctional aspartate kinase/homoserine dehydrogenase I [Myxococcota bacterium]